MRQYSKEWLEELCKDSYSYAEVLRKAERKQGGGAQATLKRKIEEWQIDISHFTGQRWQESPNQTENLQKCGKEKYKLEDIFVENSPITQKILREYVERHELLKYECVKCGCDGKWQDGFISLELDHINGNNTDNRLENLRYLCPNCHALTETYRGKNKALKNQCVETIHQQPKS